MDCGRRLPEARFRPWGGLPDYRWLLSIVVHSSSNNARIQIKVRAVKVIEAAFRASCSISQYGLATAVRCLTKDGRFRLNVLFRPQP